MQASPTLLIVEDEELLRTALSDKFSGEGFEVVTENDGDVGLERALELHPDVILLDCIMPKMSGDIFLQKLREDTWGQGATVIILSNFLDPQMRSKVTELGVEHFLVKTEWAIGDVVKKVKTILDV